MASAPIPSDQVLERIGLQRYSERFDEEGFGRWDALMDVTEEDLIAMDVRRGERRILQREIASARGLPLLNYLPPTRSTANSMDEQEQGEEQQSAKHERRSPSVSSQKRKYRRHPKPDMNRPLKPPSAYVMFSNQVRLDVKGQQLSFTDTAKTAGDRWKAIPLAHKEQLEKDALKAKRTYQGDLEEYKRTEQYRTYQDYLHEFHKRYERPATRKRMRMEPDLVRGSSGSWQPPIWGRQQEASNSSSSSSSLAPLQQMQSSPSSLQQYTVRNYRQGMQRPLESGQTSSTNPVPSLPSQGSNLSNSSVSTSEPRSNQLRSLPLPHIHQYDQQSKHFGSVFYPPPLLTHMTSEAEQEPQGKRGENGDRGESGPKGNAGAP